MVAVLLLPFEKGPFSLLLLPTSVIHRWGFAWLGFYISREWRFPSTVTERVLHCYITERDLLISYLNGRPQVQLLGVAAEQIPRSVQLDEVQSVLRTGENLLQKMRQDGIW